MAGGLIQIASYGSQDLTLTGNPQITYFRIVFRRYTNFGKRIVEVAFNNPTNFGLTSTISIPKSGDLLSKVFLKIKLPSIDLTELNNKLDINTELNNYQTLKLQKYYLYYDYFILFINKLKNIVKTFFVNNDNLITFTYIQDLKNYILTYIQSGEYAQYFNIVDYFFNDGSVATNINTNLYKNASLFKYIDNSILYYIYEIYTNDYSLNNNNNYDIFKFTIKSNMDILDELNVLLYKKLRIIFTKSELVTIGWIDKIGIFIMDNIELSIGSNIITNFSSNYIDIDGQLTYKNIDLYNKIIGNNQDYNKTNATQPDIYLYTPIPFWFQNNYGSSIPLVALQYNDIQIKIKFKNLVDCIYFNIPDIGNTATQEIRTQIITLILSKTINIFLSKLEITMLFEYIYLDNIERKKFAQSSHEYLITQVQEIIFENVSSLNNNFDLDFFHCCKNMYWAVNQYKYINNITEKNQYDKYSIELINPITTINPNNNIDNIQYINYINNLYNPYTLYNHNDFINGLWIIKTSSFKLNNINNNINTIFNNFIGSVNYTITPITSSGIYLNGTTLINQNSEYFNYLQPYNYYNNTPSVGINVYSFSLNPLEYQPSGTCNLSRIPKTSLKMNILDPTINLETTNNIKGISSLDNLSTNNLNNYRLFVIVNNFNVLRFIGGIVGVAFTY